MARRSVRLSRFLALAALLMAGSGCQALGGLFRGGFGGGLLGGAGGGPLGILLSIVTAIPPPPNPLDAEFQATATPLSPLKLVVPGPVNTQIAGRLVANLTAVPVAGALGPDGMVYYTEKVTGRVRRFNPLGNGIDPTVVLDLPVNSSGFRGLNGIAFAPDGSRLFLSYVRSATDADTAGPDQALESRLSSFPFPNPSPDAEIVLLRFPPADALFPSDINGIGTCQVGPDGRIYVSHGDYNNRLSALDLNPANPGGKIFRLELNGNTPADNPLGPENPIFCLGLRDPFGFTFDSQDGTLWIADRGSGFSDELNLGVPGANYGWPLIKGAPNTEWEQLLSLIPFVFREPTIDFGRPDPNPAPTSVVVVRGSPYGDELEGNVLYAHYELPGKVVRVRYLAADPVVNWGDVWFAPPEAGRTVGLVRLADGRVVVLCQDQVYRLELGP